MFDPEEPNRFLNHYHCSECGHEWEDPSPSTNNDRCPVCNTEIEPYKSDDLPIEEDTEKMK